MLSIFFAQIRRLSHISPGLKLISHKYLTDILVKNCKWLSRWELFPGRCWRHHFSRGINRTGQGSPVCSPGSTEFLLFSLTDVFRRRQSSSHGGVPELVVEQACPWFLCTYLPAQHSEEGKPACGGDCVCFQHRRWKCYTEHPTVTRLTDEDSVACLSVDRALRDGSSFFL